MLRHLRELYGLDDGVAFRLLRVLAIDAPDVPPCMGVSQPTVAGFERYDANPRLSTVRRYTLAVGARLCTTVIDDCADRRP